MSKSPKVGVPSFPDVGEGIILPPVTPYIRWWTVITGEGANNHAHWVAWRVGVII